MKKKLKKILYSKSFPLYLAGFLVLLVCLIILCSFFMPHNGGSKYGNRLNGINKVPVTNKIKSSVKEKIEANEKNSGYKMYIHGKIINVVYNVSEDVTVDDAKNYANEVVNAFPEKIKDFYDIQILITKKGEKGTETQINNEDGTTKTEMVKEFPIIGYKNSSQDNLIW